MQTLFNNLWGCVVCAKDGMAGRVEDLFFDDRSGGVHHVVLTRGFWPKKHRVAVEPGSLTDDLQGHLLIDMTCDEVGRAPHPDSYPPVSRQLQLNTDTSIVPDEVLSGMQPIEVQLPGEEESQNKFFNTSDLTPFVKLLTVHRHRQTKEHLRSVRAITGYGVEIQGGRIGSVLDVWLDTTTWQIAHLSLHLERSNQRVAVPLSLVRGISWGTATIRLSAYWNSEAEGGSLQPCVAPPRERVRSFGDTFRFGAFAMDVAST